MANLVPGSRRGWAVLVPVKGGPAAKSRLGAGPTVAAAIAADCLAAVLACARVSRPCVVTPDRAFARRAGAAGARVIVQPPDRPGLTQGVTLGLAEIARETSGEQHPRRPCAVLLGDLPSLRPEDLRTALDAAWTALTGPGAPASVHVPDAAGTGTVLLAGREAGHLRHDFGDASAMRHARSGSVALPLDLPRLRSDVDTPADLDRARLLGLGPATRAALEAVGAAAAVAPT